MIKENGAIDMGNKLIAVRAEVRAIDRLSWHSKFMTQK